MINKYLSQIAATILPALMSRSDQPGYSAVPVPLSARYTEAIFESVSMAKTLSDAVSEIITPKNQDAPVNSDAQSAIQQSAVADLPAADISIVKYKTALSVFDQFIFDYNGQSAPFIAFRDYCQQQLTALAGR